MAHARRVALLLEWCALQGVVLDNRIEIQSVPMLLDDDSELEWHSEPGALVVRAKECIPRGVLRTYIAYLVVWIPSTALLSIKSSALARCALFQEACAVCKDNALHLALCLALERCLGAASRFEGYVQSLPRRVSLPMCWEASSNEAKWLYGTEAWRNVQRAAQYWDQDVPIKPGYSLVRTQRLI